MLKRGVTFLSFITILALATGCSSFRKTGVEVQQGAWVVCCGGKVEVAVPERHLMAETNKPFKEAFVLRPSMPYLSQTATYSIQPVNPLTDSNGVLLPPPEILESHVAAVWRANFRAKRVVVKETSEDWDGEPSYYHEWFIPGDIRPMRLLFIFKMKNSWKIRRPHLAVIGRLVKKGTNYYWVHAYFESQDYEPVPNVRVEAEDRSKFDQFTDGIRLKP